MAATSASFQDGIGTQSMLTGLSRLTSWSKWLHSDSFATTMEKSWSLSLER